MLGIFEFEAVSRDKTSASSARAIRRDGKVPAVLYGSGGEPTAISLSHNEMLKRLEHEAVYSHVLDLKVNGKVEKAILKDIQRHPSKPVILHMDFQRINKSEKLRMNVPLHFLNEQESVGVKKGGVVMHSLVDVEVTCLPSDLPEYIEVDLIGLDIGDSIHLSEIKAPKDVEFPALLQGTDHDLMVVSVMANKVVEEVEEVVEEEAAPDEGEKEEKESE